MGGGPGENVALALEAASLDEVTDPVGRTFRAFADQTRSDRLALAACLRGSRGLMIETGSRSIDVPGADRGRHGRSDRGLGRGAREDHSGFAGARYSRLRDHMRAVGDKVYKAGVLDFLSRRQ